MKKVLKLILRAPFLLLNKIIIDKKSLLWRISDDILNDKDKIELSKKAQFKIIAQKSPPKGFKIISYLNALRHDTIIANSFSKNVIEHLQLFESQLGQDCMVDTIFQGKTDGVFVEVGVGEGRSISNTYFFEKYRNWTGILCEPSEKFHSSIKRDRNAELVINAVYDKSGIELNFCEVEGAEELSTLSDYRENDSHDRSKVKEYRVVTISFNDLCKKYLDNKKIDYLSIDTEGSEYLILSAIDYNNIDISVISVEHNYDTDKLKKISLLLQKFDYVEILPGVFEFDSFFIKRSIESTFISRIIK